MKKIIIAIAAVVAAVTAIVLVAGIKNLDKEFTSGEHQFFVFT